MKRSFSSLIIFGLLWAGAAHAKDPSVLDEVMAKKSQTIQNLQKLIGPQYQLVGAYKTSRGFRSLKTGDELVASVSSSFAYGDVNLDGRQDLAVAVENTQGQRAFRVYLGESDGSLKLHREGSKVILASDAKTESDSFNSVQISKTGLISISHLDDLTMAWNRIQKFQFQNGEIILIGQRLVSTGAFGTKVEDQNFVTGEQTVKTMRSVSSPSVFFKSQLPKATGLTKLEDSIVTKD